MDTVRPATPGEKLYLGIDWHGKPVFYPKGLRISDCTVRIENGARIHCSNLPKELMQPFFLEETVIFVLRRQWRDAGDYLELDSTYIPLYLFLQASVDDTQRMTIMFLALKEDEMSDDDLPEHLRDVATPTNDPATVAEIYRR